MSKEALRKTLLYSGLAVFVLGIVLMYVFWNARIVGVIIGTVGLTIAIIAAKPVWSQLRWNRN